MISAGLSRSGILRVPCLWFLTAFFQWLTTLLPIAPPSGALDHRPQASGKRVEGAATSALDSKRRIDSSGVVLRHVWGKWSKPLLNREAGIGCWLAPKRLSPILSRSRNPASKRAFATGQSAKTDAALCQRAYCALHRTPHSVPRDWLGESVQNLS